MLELKAVTRMSLLGPKANIYTPVVPDPLLLDHWTDKLYAGSHPNFEYHQLGVPMPHVVSFPLSYLDSSLHWVDPDVLYRLYSKEFIPQIACPQAAVLDPEHLTYPCVLKTYRACSGLYM